MRRGRHCHYISDAIWKRFGGGEGMQISTGCKNIPQTDLFFAAVAFIGGGFPSIA